LHWLGKLRRPLRGCRLVITDQPRNQRTVQVVSSQTLQPDVLDHLAEVGSVGREALGVVAQRNKLDVSHQGQSLAWFRP
jgi:hypothetical protein